MRVSEKLRYQSTIVVAVCGLIIGLAVCVALLFLAVHARHIVDVKDRIAAENEILKTIVQMVGGTVIIAGLYFTWRNIHVAQEGQITDRFNKAVDHLGQPDSSIRLGGIYALARIAADSPRDASTITQILTAFVRESSSKSTDGPPSVEVQSVVSILTSCDWALRNTRDFTACSFRKLTLKRADFSGCIFADANFSGANLEGANFEGSTLAGVIATDAYLRECNFRNANMVAATLRGSSLKNAKFQASNIFAVDFTDASMFGANFEHAQGGVRQQFDSGLFDETTVLPTFDTELPDNPIRFVN